MRKKVLIEQNLALFEQLQKAQLEVNELKKTLKGYDEKMAKLEGELEELRKAEEVQTAPLKKLEEKVIANANLKPDVEYGAKIIGEIVVSATNYSNNLTAGGESANRELVNLILGKTEVAKSEILNIVSGEASLDVKQTLIDSVRDDAQEYFKSLMAQL